MEKMAGDETLDMFEGELVGEWPPALPAFREILTDPKKWGRDTAVRILDEIGARLLLLQSPGAEFEGILRGIVGAEDFPLKDVKAKAGEVLASLDRARAKPKASNS